MTLSTAYWCVVIAALLPYPWAVIAKASGEKLDNRDPRGWLTRQKNPRSIHANAAQLNAFEAFAPFAIGVVLAQLAGVEHHTIAVLSIIFIVFRVLHGVFYLAGKPTLRSLSWAGGLVCVVALLVQAALHAG
ncbi:MAG TPA: MAPEG family protein [Lysobacter sp.]|nr:MAPEG family protein [Lysobacter sp.]